MSPTDLLRVSLTILSAFSYLPIYGHRLKIINMTANRRKYILRAYKLIGSEAVEE